MPTTAKKKGKWLYPNLLGDIQKEVRDGIGDIYRKDATETEKRREASQTRIMESLNAAGAALNYLLENVAGFREYFAQHSQPFRQHFGANAGEAFMDKYGGILVVGWYGYSNQPGSLCIGINDRVVYVTRTHKSSDPDIMYHKPLDRGDLGFVDCPSILAKLDSMKRPQNLLRALVFSITHREMFP